MMNTKVIGELFELTSDNEKIYRIISSGDRFNVIEQPFMGLLRLLSTEDFVALSSKLRICDLEKCDDYAKKLVGETPSKFWEADPDTVYNGIMAVLGDANDSTNDNRGEALMVFRLLTWVISSDNHKQLSNLFYTKEFYKRLESLKEYGVDGMSCYVYLNCVLESDEKRYATLVETKSDTDNSLHQFVNCVIDGSEWKSVILSSIKIHGFRAALLDCIVKRSLNEENNHRLAQMYAILLIFYSGEEISVAYEPHNHWFNSTIMSNYIIGKETNTCMMIDLVANWCLGAGGKYLLQTVVYKIGAMRDSCRINNNILDVIVEFCNYHIDH